MKKILLSCMCIAMIIHSFCQTNPTLLTNEDYLKKSKNQKTTAWVLLAGGATLFTIGSTVGINFDGLFDPNQPNPPPRKNNETLATVLQIAGGAAMLASIPLFVAASKNKKKGMSISFKNQPVTQLQNSSFVYRAVPSLNIKISL